MMVNKESFFKVLSIIILILIMFFFVAEIFLLSFSTDQNIAGQGPGISVKTATPGGIIVAAAKAILKPTPKPVGDATILDDQSSGDGDTSGEEEETDKDTEGVAFTGVGCLVDC